MTNNTHPTLEIISTANKSGSQRYYNPGKGLRLINMKGSGNDKRGIHNKNNRNSEKGFIPGVEEAEGSFEEEVRQTSLLKARGGVAGK